MLDDPQGPVGVGEVVGGLARDPAGGDQRLHGLDRRPDPEGGIAPAPDQLLGLGEELDLADAAAAELEIMAGDRDVGAALGGMDLSLD